MYKVVFFLFTLFLLGCSKEGNIIDTVVGGAINGAIIEPINNVVYGSKEERQKRKEECTALYRSCLIQYGARNTSSILDKDQLVINMTAKSLCDKEVKCRK